VRERLLTLLFILFIPLILQAQDKEEAKGDKVRIERVDSTDFPRLTAFVCVEDEEGEPNLSLVKGNFTVKVDTNDPVDSLELQPFKMLEEPVHYVFFLSASGLMDGRPLTAQKNALLDFGANMREGDTLSAYLVGETAGEIFSYAGSAVIPEDAVQEISVSEAQPKIFDTLVSGVRMVEKDRSEEKIGVKDRVVFLLISDGRDNENRFTLEQTGQILSDGGIPLYAVGLKTLSESSLSVLDELSLLTGGAYYYTPRADMLPEQLEGALQRILMSYVLSFKVKGVKGDDSYHQLMIQVSEKEFISQAFRNFIARKSPFPPWLKILLLIFTVILLAVMILLILFSRIRLRKKLGITKRRCPECKRRMRDDWEFCPFCRYLEPKKRRRARKEESA